MFLQQILYKYIFILPQGWDGNGRQYCVRMHSGSGSVGDKDCSDAYSFLCQYDCDNIFTGKVRNFGNMNYCINLFLSNFVFCVP